jgi:hypothetical protein
MDWSLNTLTVTAFTKVDARQRRLGHASIVRCAPRGAFLQHAGKVSTGDPRLATPNGQLFEQIEHRVRRDTQLKILLVELADAHQHRTHPDSLRAFHIAAAGDTDRPSIVGRAAQHAQPHLEERRTRNQPASQPAHCLAVR